MKKIHYLDNDDDVSTMKNSLFQAEEREKIHYNVEKIELNYAYYPNLLTKIVQNFD